MEKREDRSGTMIEHVEEIRPGRGRPWRRRLLIALVVVALAAGAIVLCGGPMLRWIALGRLSSMTGGRAVASDVSLLPDGTLRFERLVILAPDVPGEGAEVFRAEIAQVRLDPGLLLRGTVRVRAVVLHSPVFRVSQSIEDGSVNIGALRPARRGGGRMEIPPMNVHAGAVELGEHWGLTRQPGYRVLRRIPVAGQVAQSLEGPDLRIAFHECDEQGNPLPGPGGLQLTGIVRQDSVTINLGSISLSQWQPESVPTPIRQAYRELALDGEVRGATLTYEFDGDVIARAELHGVAVTVPVEVKPAETRSGEVRPLPAQDIGRRLRLESVNGSVSLSSGAVEADLRGIAQGIPYEVRLRSQGSAPDSPFTCTIVCRAVRVERKPEILKFAPGIAQRRFEQFGDPTGEIDAEVTISRREGERAEDFHVAGRILLRDVRAAFERFPYPFRELTGEVEFDDDGVYIRRITGKGEGGGELVAEGTITPISDDAGVRIDVIARGIPIDATLRGAMASRGRIMEELIDEGALARLRAKGLVRGAGESGDAPVFEPGGTIDVHARITRDAGSGPDRWHDEVTITLREARLLARSMAYPVVAHDVVILKRDDEATVSGGTWEGLAGGRIEIGARVDLGALGDLDAPFVPEVDCRASDVPITALLLTCVPEVRMPSGRTLAQTLSDMTLSGRVDMHVRVRPVVGGAAYSVEIDGREVRASPPVSGGSPRQELVDGWFGVDVTNEKIEAGVEGLLTAPGVRGSRVRVRASVARPEGVVRVEGDLPQFDLSLPVEDWVYLFAAAAGDELSSVRAKHAPAGRASLAVRIERDAGGRSVLRADVSDLREASFLAPGGRVGLTQKSGAIAIERREGEAGTVTLRDVTLRIGHEGEPGGEVNLDGMWGLDGSARDEPLRVLVRGVRFESPLVRAILAAGGPKRLADYLMEIDARGEFDLDATLGRGEAGRGVVQGVLRPRTFSARFDGQDVCFQSVRGEIEFSPRWGRVHGLQLASPTLRVGADGGWMSGDDGATRLHAEGMVEAATLAPDLLAILPRGVAEAARGLSLDIGAGLRLTDASLSLSLDADGGVRSMGMRGLAAVKGASLDVGVKITDADGVIEFSTGMDESGTPAFDMLGVFDRTRWAGVMTTGGRVRLSGLPDGRVVMPYFAASCHGGRVTGEAHIDPPRSADGRRYFASVRVSGVRFASVLRDLAVETTPGEAPPDESRGILDAAVDLAGVLGEASSRRGRGSGAVYGGRVVSLPLIVPLVKITNLQLPTNEDLDVARAEFFLQGEYLNFESLGVYSRSVEIAGFGTIRWPGMEVDMRLRPRARQRIPVFTGLFEGIREELLSVRAEGTLNRPELAVSTLSGTSRFVSHLFGEEPDEQQRRLDMIERRGRETPRRKEARPEEIRP
jgi:hypothetical protein